MSSSKEFRKHIPNFSLKPDAGGLLVNEINDREGQIAYEAVTSKYSVDFSLMDDGFRALFYAQGVGVLYDTEGNLTAIKIELLRFLKSLLNDNDLDGYSENDFLDLLELGYKLESGSEDIIAHLDLSKGKFLVYGANKKNEEDTKVYTYSERDDFDSPSFLSLALGDISFVLAFWRTDDSFEIGLGIYDDVSDEPSLIGDLPNSSNEEKNNNLAILLKHLALDCNFMTYLDSKKPDRFDKLAQRIILD